MRKKVSLFFVAGLVVALAMPALAAKAKRHKAFSSSYSAGHAPAAHQVVWTYLAKRMRPPKNAKWQKRWNALGADGWELVGGEEGIYIFKKPSTFRQVSAGTSSSGSFSAKTKTKTAAKAVVRKYAPKAGKAIKSTTSKSPKNTSFSRYAR